LIHTNVERLVDASILVVDDTLANLQLLSAILKEQGYRPRPVPNGRLALQAARLDPPDLILLDICMPDMDGYEVCRRLKADDRLSKIPVIFISALTDTMDKVKAFAVGGVDYVPKPFQTEEVLARISTHLTLRRLQVEQEHYNRNLQEIVEAQVKQILDSQMATLFAMAKLAESRDLSTGKHLERVQGYCKLMAIKLYEDTSYHRPIQSAVVDNIFYACILHDIGKVGIPDSILLKPGRLTAQEFEVMKTHPMIGYRTLEAVHHHYPKNTFIDMGMEIARSHHEWWDGSGYPDGLAGEDIPILARIMAVADVYDAMRSRRVYKPAVNHEESCDVILTGSAKQFDPMLVQVFAHEHQEFNAIWDSLQK
jgi:putative two-component system response regulator